MIWFSTKKREEIFNVICIREHFDSPSVLTNKDWGFSLSNFYFKILLTSPIEILHEARYGVKGDLIKKYVYFSWRRYK